MDKEDKFSVECPSCKRYLIFQPPMDDYLKDGMTLYCPACLHTWNYYTRVSKNDEHLNPPNLDDMFDTYKTGYIRRGRNGTENNNGSTENPVWVEVNEK